MSSEKFCLRWNDFESNVSCAFKEIRDEKEFFDVTIACEDEQLQAHKLILSACSPFFKNVLRRNQHQHPLLYLKGVSFRDMESVLTFMYHGEVNVAQDDLNSFLQVAEDLKVKGLTQNNSDSTLNETKNHSAASKTEPKTDLHRPLPTEYNTPHAAKHIRPPPPNPKLTPQPQQEDDCQVFVPVVKSEPRDPLPSIMSNHIQTTVEQEQPMAMYEDGSQQMQDTMMEQYDDNYEYEGQFVNDGYDHPGMVGIGGQDSSGAGKKQCGQCGEWYHSASIKRHQKEQHSEYKLEFKCENCGKVFNNKSTFGNHLRKVHGIYKTL